MSSFLMGNRFVRFRLENEKTFVSITVSRVCALQQSGSIITHQNGVSREICASQHLCNRLIRMENAPRIGGG
ncbi:hypothetical protein [Paraburkholderia sp. J12]|uniref:hypothetical protein n=1 Tax=Paraburkholderia sp. J12 TaxID=2805432 RepID=UPI002ABD175B|nr:hypothetical protein [Paraburkholderia sp. J12]